MPPMVSLHIYLAKADGDLLSPGDTKRYFAALMRKAATLVEKSNSDAGFAELTNAESGRPDGTLHFNAGRPDLDD